MEYGRISRRLGALLSLTLACLAFGRPAQAQSRPLVFEINEGQTDKRVRFLARYGESTVFLTPQEMVMEVTEWEAAEPVKDPEQRRFAKDPQKPAKGRRANVRMRFRGANPNPQVVGLDPLPGKSHYLIGNDPKKWQRNVAQYGRVEYRGLYRGIDLVFYSRAGKLEYDFVVAAGADPSAIDLEFAGMRSAEVAAQGDLVLATERARIVHRKPSSYQGTEKEKTPVATEFTLQGPDRVAFKVTGRDPKRPLRIDPEIVYLWSYDNFEPLSDPPAWPYRWINPGETYPRAVAVDPQGNSYVTGFTRSAQFPTTAGAVQVTNPDVGMGSDAFVFKLSPDGQTLVYSTYLGGTYADWANDVAVDAQGQAHVTGATASSDFPVVSALWGDLGDAEGDAFVSKLASDGSSFVYSTRVGGAQFDTLYAIALDGFGNAYAVGETASGAFSPNSLPIGDTCPETNSLDFQDPQIHDLRTCRDGFVVKINAGGTSETHRWMGDSPEFGSGWSEDVAIDGQGFIYVRGYAPKNAYPFAGRYIRKLDQNLSAVWRGRFPGVDGPMAVARDGTVYVVGWSGTAYQIHRVVVGENLDTSLETVMSGYGTSYWTSGWTIDDKVTALAVDGEGNLFLAGYRTLFDADLFPYVIYAWIAKFDQDGQLLGDVALGGSQEGEVFIQEDWIDALVLDEDGNVYVTGTGFGQSDQFPIFVAKLLGDSFTRTDPSMRGTCEDCRMDNVGHPVNIYTGNTWLDQVDATLPGVGPALVMARSYNSLSALEKAPSNIGLGWSHPYMGRLEPGTGRLRLIQGNGVPIVFQNVNPLETKLRAVNPATETSWIEQTPDGSTRSFREGGSESYDRDGKLTRRVDAAGNETVLTYDTAGYLQSVQDVASARKLEFLTDGSGRITQVSGPDGLIATYSYDGGGRLTGVSYPGGGRYDFSYDPLGQLLSVTDATQTILETHTYQDFKAVSSEKANGQERVSLSYLPGVTKVTDALNNVTTYQWTEVQGSKKLAKRTGPCATCGNGTSESWTYFPDGRIETYTDGDQKTTTYTYNSHGDVETVTVPLVGTTNYNYTYDPNTGRILTSTVEAPGQGAVTTSYGLFGPESIVKTVAAGETWSTTFAYLRGKLETVTDPRQKTTHYSYTLQGDLYEVLDPLGNGTKFLSYDPMGRVLKAQDPVGNVTETRYDVAGRVDRVTRPDLKFSQFGYDTAGRRTSVTDVKNRTTFYAYDPYGRLISVKDPKNGVVEYGYDKMSRMNLLEDPADRRTRFEYDGFGRIAKTTWPGGSSETVTYDNAGRIKTRDDRRHIVTTYSYDVAGRLTAKSYSNGEPSVSYTYDAASRLQSVSNGTDTLTYAYDLGGNVLSETSAKNASTAGYTYYPGGLRKELKLNGAIYLEYFYDDTGRLTSLSRGTSNFGFDYDQASRRTSRTNPNATVVSYGYDQLSRLTGLGNAAIGIANYAYDEVGNRTAKTGTLSPAEGYSYDDLDRLTSVTRGSTLSEAYDFDKVGNITLNQKGTLLLQGSFNDRNELLSESAGGSLRFRGHLDEGGRVTVNGQPARAVSDTVFEADVPIASGTNDVSVEARDWSGNTRTNTYRMEIGAGTPATFGYDANGNMVEKVEGATTWTYGWNAENQLVRVCKDTSPCTDATALARFAYDPLGRRVEKVASGVTYSYLYDGQDILRETITSGATTTVYKYIHGPGVDEPLAREDAAGTLAYYYADGLGSIVKMTDAAGGVIQSRQYDAFGNLEVGASEPGYSYTGREWDPETGLYYYRARYYDPKAGRFISEDPIGFGGGINFYGYAGSNPVNRVDPLGLWSPEAHDMLLAHALERRIGGVALLNLQDSSRQIDIYYQGTEYSYMHGMARRGQSTTDAIAERNAWVASQLREARELAKQGRRADALTALGKGLHAVMDSYSPEHQENGQCKVWDPLRHPGRASGHSPNEHWGHETSSGITPEIYAAMDKMINYAYDTVFGGVE